MGEALRSQIATLKPGKRGTHRKYLPFVFSEHGAIMAANVLQSQVAIDASIQIVRTFVRFRELTISHTQLLHKVNQMEKSTITNSNLFLKPYANL